MNHIYRLIWNDTLRTWVVANEQTRSRGKRASGVVGSAVRSATVALGMVSAAAIAAPPAPVAPVAPTALPTAGQVVAGQASIQQAGAQLNVTQTSAKAIVNWGSFNIGAQASVQFNQPGADSVALNRVIGSDASTILGRLSSNGQVFLVNPNGVLFGAGAQVDVGGLVASTLSLSDENFLHGHYRFERGGATAAVLNLGALAAGYVALLAPEVRNEGAVVASMGTAALAAGEAVTLGITGHKLIDVQVDRATVDTLVENRNLVRVDGGTAVLSAQSAQALLGQVVNTGSIEANGIDATGGTLRLTASHAIALGGRVSADAGARGDGGTILAVADLGNASSRTDVTGTLSARGGAAGGDGGFIDTSASQLKIGGTARVDTSAAQGTFGQWLLDPIDFTIAAVGGDITGAALSAALQTTHVTIQTADASASCTGATCGGGKAGNGDIFVNDAVSWSSDRTLTLSAWRHVNIHAPISVPGAGRLALEFGQSDTMAGFPDGTYQVHAPVSLAVGAGFSTKLATDGATVHHTVIHDAAGLAGIAADLNGAYVLGGNVTAPMASWTPLGSIAQPFGGSFDGLGHVVSQLSHTNAGADENVGLFGVNDGLIQNVGVVAANVDGSRNVGALVGFNNGFVINSYAKGTVTGSGATVGGIGGLVGYNMGLIGLSYADVTVSAPAGDQSSGDPLVDGTGGIGGLVGVLGGAVNDSYARGSVTGVNAVGGLVGYSAGTIGASYSSGAVGGTSNVAGLVGQVSDPFAFTPFIFDSHWDTDTSGQAQGGGGVADFVAGHDTTTMKSPSTFSTWDTSVWELRNGQYPMLKQMLKPVFAVADDKTATYSGAAFTAFTGGTNPGTLPGGTLVGSLTYTPSSANPTNAGTYTVTPGGLSVADAADQNGYRIEFVPGTLTINPAPLTVTANGFTKTYDGNPYSGGNGVSYTGFVGGETAAVLGGTLSYAGSSQGAVNVGSYVITPQGLTSSNYTLSFVDGTLTIDPAVLHVITGSLVGSVSKVYDGNSNVTGLTPGHFSLSGWQGTDNATVTKTTGVYADGPNASASTTRQVTVSLQASDFSPVGSTNLSNYTLPTSVSGHIGEISKRPITATLIGTVSKTYDGTDQAALVGSNYNYSVGNYVAGEGAYLAGTNSWQTGTFSQKDVGNGLLVTVNINPADYQPWGSTNLDNYSFPTTVSGNVGRITPKDVTASLIGTPSKPYDGTTGVTFTADHIKFEGFVQGEYVIPADQFSLETGGLVGSLSGKDVGTHAATLTMTGWAPFFSSAKASNYNLPSLIKTTATVTPRELTVSGTAVATKVYDGTTAATIMAGTLVNLVKGEQLTLAASGAFDSRHAGDAQATVHYTHGDGSGGGLASNYVVPASVQVLGKIDPRTVQFAAPQITKVYDGTASFAGAVELAPLTAALGVAGDQVTGITLGFGSQHAGAGKAPSRLSDAKIDDGNNGGNYKVTYVDNLASTISPLELTIGQLPALSKVYDGLATYQLTPEQLVGLAAGLVNGDTLGSATATFGSRNAGTHTVRLSDVSIQDGNGGANYKPTIGPGTATGTIQRKELTLSPNFKKTYDGLTSYTLTAQELASLASQLGAGDAIGSISVEVNDKHAGTHVARFGGLTLNDGNGGNNYSVQLKDGTVEVLTRDVAVHSLVANKVYDGNRYVVVTGLLGPVAGSSRPSGLVAGEQLAYRGRGLFSTADAQSGGVAISGFDLDAGPRGERASNYNLVNEPTGAWGTISKRPVTIEGLVAQNAFYEKPNESDLIPGMANVTGVAKFIGILPQDRDEVTTPRLIWVYENPKPNTVVNVIPARLAFYVPELGGDKADNYVLVFPALRAALLERDLGKSVLAAITMTNPSGDQGNVYSDMSRELGEPGSHRDDNLISRKNLDFSYNLLRTALFLQDEQYTTASINLLKAHINRVIGGLCSSCGFSDAEWNVFVEGERQKAQKLREAQGR